MQTLRLVLKDPVLIAKFQAVAKKQRVSDWRKLARGTTMRAIMQALGMESDLTPAQAATELNVHLNTIWNWHRQTPSKFPGFYYLSARKPRIPRKDVDALKAQTVLVA